MKRLKKAMIGYAVNHHKMVLFAMIAATLVAGSFLPRVEIDTDPENMLKKSEPVRVFHNQTKAAFDLSDIVVLGVINEKHPNGVFNPATLKRIYELTQFAKTLRWEDKESPNRFEGVIEADMIAPSVTDHMSQGEPGTIKFEWLMAKPPKTEEEALLIRDRALSNPLLKGRMVSEDGRAVCIYLPLTDKLLSYRIFTELNKKIKDLDGNEEYHITGLPVAEGAVGVEMFTEMGVASPLSMLLVMGLLLLFFRKWVLIVSPMIIATFSIITSMGLMIGLGFEVHILSSMLPIFLMSIAIVDSIHVLSEFFDVYTIKKGRKESIKEVINTLFVPMFYTSLTTAAGFLSLTLTSIPPARIFGIFLCAGVMIAWLCTIMFVPAYIMMLPERMFENFGLKAQQKEKESLMTRGLRSIGIITHKYAKPLLAVFIVIVAAASWGILQTRINDNYSKRFTLDHPIRKADIALNSHFGGTYTAYLVLESEKEKKLTKEWVNKIDEKVTRFALDISDEFKKAPRLARELVSRQFPNFTQNHITREGFLDSTLESIDKLSANASDEEYYAWQELQGYLGLEKEKLKTFKHPEVLRYMADLQEYLEKSGLVGKTGSVADVVRKVNQELIDGKPANFQIPDKLTGIAECYLQFQQSHRPQDLWHMVTPDFQRANIILQMTSGNSLDMEAVVKAVDAWFLQNPPPAQLSYKWAGLHYVNLFFQNKMFWEMLWSFLQSFLIVLVMMTVLFRSFKWGLLCMVPLSITIAGIYGVVGIIGKDYDMPIAVLSVLSIGIAVDFAIHFLERCRITYRKLGSWEKVVPEMFGEPARAISRNVMVIAIGFLPLTVAQLIPYKVTGLMLFAILSFSGIITLLVLPAVLSLAEKSFFKNIKTTSAEDDKSSSVTGSRLVNGKTA
ncbi:MAG: MMPL family transporter [Desulfobacteraceae bacterium]|nr:MMPL family transporter [Desulfobacteraceae bacterium]